MPQFDKEEIRKSASGHWIRIFEQFAGDVLEDALNRIGRHVDCPFHPEGRDGTNDFRLDYQANENGKAFCNCGNFDGFELLMRANDWTFPIVLEEISSFLGIESTQTIGRWRKKPSREDIKRNQQKSKEMAIKQQLINERTEKSIQQILDGCCDYEHPRAIEYFKHRGIDVDILPDSILFHPNLIYRGNDDYGKDFISYFPALIGLYQRVDDEFVNILRIYLSNQNSGKADVKAPKKQWSPIRPKATNGAAIRLDPAKEHIAVAEGIETAMAVRYATNLTTWAAGNTNGMKTLELPKIVKEVLIWADNDSSGAGEKAAEFLADKLRREGKKVAIRLPMREDNRRSRDWLDVLNEEGVEVLRKKAISSGWPELNYDHE